MNDPSMTVPENLPRGAAFFDGKAAFHSPASLETDGRGAE